MEDEPRDQSGKLIPLVYKDLVSPAAREAGSTVGGVVRSVLAPVNFTVWTIDQVMEYAREKVAQRLERWRTPPSRINAPPPEILGPVLQALRFPTQDSTLREMYLNLLAGSMDQRYPDRNHPAFVEVLRQLSPLEARILPILPAEGRSIPLVGVRRFLGPDEFHTVLKHANRLGADLRPRVAIPRQAIDNICRLGIIAVHEEQRLNDEESYAAIEALPEVASAVSSSESVGGTPRYHRYLAEVTKFGSEFMSAISEPVPGAA